MSAVRQIETATTPEPRQTLERKRADLRRAVGYRDEISIVQAADVIDALQLAQERTLAMENLDLDTHLLRQVETALDRMDEGTYGACMHCEDPITEKRLRALPWAILCVRCQELEERRNPRHSMPPLEEAA